MHIDSAPRIAALVLAPSIACLVGCEPEVTSGTAARQDSKQTDTTANNVTQTSEDAADGDQQNPLTLLVLDYLESVAFSKYTQATISSFDVPAKEGDEPEVRYVANMFSMPTEMIVRQTQIAPDGRTNSQIWRGAEGEGFDCLFEQYGAVNQRMLTHESRGGFFYNATFLLLERVFPGFMFSSPGLPSQLQDVLQSDGLLSIGEANDRISCELAHHGRPDETRIRLHFERTGEQAIRLAEWEFFMATAPDGDQTPFAERLEHTVSITATEWASWRGQEIPVRFLKGAWARDMDIDVTTVYHIESLTEEPTQEIEELRSALTLRDGDSIIDRALDLLTCPHFMCQRL